MKVAVYGTLRQGFWNNKLLENSTFLGKTKTEPVFTMYGHGVPWILNGGNTEIVIEVYEIDEETFRSLDLLEGYPSYYDRQLINTEFGEAWIYFRYIEGGFIVESGDWYEFKRGVMA